MHYWSFFILVLVVSGPVASFSQHDHIYVRQQCVDGREREFTLNRDQTTSSDSILKNHDTIWNSRDRSRDLSESRRNEVRNVEPRAELIFTRPSVNERMVFIRSIRVAPFSITRKYNGVLTRETRKASNNQRTRPVNGDDRRISPKAIQLTEIRNLKYSRSRDSRDFRDFTFRVEGTRNIRKESERDTSRISSARLQHAEPSRDQRSSRTARDLAVRYFRESNNLRDTRYIQERARNEATIRSREQVQIIRENWQPRVSREGDNEHFMDVGERRTEIERRFLEINRNMDQHYKSRENYDTLGVRASEFRMDTRSERLEDQRLVGNDRRFSFRLSNPEESKRFDSREDHTRDMARPTISQIRMEIIHQLETRHDSQNCEPFMNTGERRKTELERRFLKKNRNTDQNYNSRENYDTLGIRASEFRMNTRSERSEDQRSMGNDHRFSFRMSDREENRRFDSREDRIKDKARLTSSQIRMERNNHLESRRDSRNREHFMDTGERRKTEVERRFLERNRNTDETHISRAKYEALGVRALESRINTRSERRENRRSMGNDHIYSFKMSDRDENRRFDSREDHIRDMARLTSSQERMERNHQLETHHNFRNRERFIESGERRKSEVERRFLERNRNMNQNHISRENYESLGVWAEFRMNIPSNTHSSENRRTMGNDNRFSFRLSDREEIRRFDSCEDRIKVMAQPTSSQILMERNHQLEIRRDRQNRETLRAERQATATPLQRMDFRRIKESLDSQINAIQNAEEHLDNRREIASVRRNQFYARERSEENHSAMLYRETREYSVSTQRIPADQNIRYRRETETKRERLTSEREMLSAERDSLRKSEPFYIDTTEYASAAEWKTLLVHTIQGIYLCGVILKIVGGNGLKRNILASWLPHQHSIKVD